MSINHKGVVVRLKNVRPHPNADRVQLATCLGNQVVVGLDNKEGDWGVYFNNDLQLSHEFCHANNLYRDKTKNKFPDEKAGMFDDNRRVRAQRFRGEISDGFWTPLYTFGFIYVTGLNVEGLELDEWGGVPICNKYINPNTLKAAQQNPSYRHLVHSALDYACMGLTSIREVFKVMQEIDDRMD